MAMMLHVSLTSTEILAKILQHCSAAIGTAAEEDVCRPYPGQLGHALEGESAVRVPFKWQIRVIDIAKCATPGVTQLWMVAVILCGCNALFWQIPLLTGKIAIVSH